MVTFILLVVGGLNWLLVGAFDLNLVMTIFGDSVLTKVVYILVGLSAIIEVINHKKNCTMCK
jgi:uncharacterized membrane protein YuzA (DUF378 family)